MNKNWQNLTKLIEYPKEGILSKEIIKTDRNNATLFCMASGTEISDHTSTKEGFVYVLEGNGVFNLAGKEIEMNDGIFIFLNKNVVHSLKAETDLTFLLFLGKD